MQIATLCFWIFVLCELQGQWPRAELRAAAQNSSCEGVKVLYALSNVVATGT